MLFLLSYYICSFTNCCSCYSFSASSTCSSDWSFLFLFYFASFSSCTAFPVNNFSSCTAFTLLLLHLLLFLSITLVTPVLVSLNILFVTPFSFILPVVNVALVPPIISVLKGDLLQESYFLDLIFQMHDD